MHPNSCARRLALLTTALTVALATVACGQKVSGGESKARTLTYWSSWSKGEPQQKIIADALTAFGDKSGVRIEARWLGRTYASTLKNANAAGKGPDLYDNGTDHLAEYRGRGEIGSLAKVLTRTVPGERKTVGEVLPAPVKQAASDAKGMGLLPYTVISTGLWYDESGSAPAATWDGFLTQLAGRKKDGRRPLAQDGTVNFYNAYWFYWLMMRHGGPGSLKALGADEGAWDRPQVLAAAKDVERLARGDYFQQDFTGTKYPAAQNAWAKGKHDFNLNGTWLAGETKPNQKPGFRPRVVEFPALPGRHRSVEVGTLGWSINAKGDHPELAADFLAFATQRRYLERFSTEALNISSRADVPAPEPLKRLQRTILGAKEVNPTYDAAPAEHAGWWNDVLLPLDDKLLAGDLTAEEFVDQGRRRTAAYLKSQAR